MANWYDDFAPANSARILPNQVSARAFRYRKSIFWTVDLLGVGIAGVEQRGQWTITISSADGSQVFFQQTVGLKLFLVKLGVPGLQLFTWNYVKDDFKTGIVAATVTTPANIGEFLQGGTALSEQGDLQPASGQESTNETATILTDWVSPIYVFDSGQQLPPGYKVTITRDTWGIGTATSTYQFAFDEGAAGYAYLDRHHAIRSLETRNNRVYLNHTYVGPGARLIRDSVSGVSNATVWKNGANRLFLMGQKDGAYRVWYSDNEGMEVLPLLYTRQNAPAGSNSGGQQVSLWSGNFKNVSPPAISKSGSIATCAQLGADLYFQFARSITSPGNIVKVGPHNNRPCFVLLEETAGNGAAILLTDNNDLQYSGDGVNDWTPIP